MDQLPQIFLPDPNVLALAAQQARTKATWLRPSCLRDALTALALAKQHNIFRLGQEAAKGEGSANCKMQNDNCECRLMPLPICILLLSICNASLSRKGTGACLLIRSPARDPPPGDFASKREHKAPRTVSPRPDLNGDNHRCLN